MEEEVSWLRDYIVQCMQSPSWTIPIAQFIDKHCMGFDADTCENKLEYTELHIEFKGLVDKLLEDHLAELSIQPDLFAQVCLDGLDGDDECGDVLRRLLATEDFLEFKELMLSRRRELEQGGANQEDTLQEPSSPSIDNDEDERQLEEALRQSRQMADQQGLEEQELQRAIELSLLEQQQSRGDAEEMKTPEEVITQQGEEKEEEQTTPEVKDRMPQQASNQIDNEEIAVADVTRKKPTKEELEARAEHLRRQRDRFLSQQQQQQGQRLAGSSNRPIATISGTPPEGVAAAAGSSSSSETGISSGISGSDLRQQLASSLMKACRKQFDKGLFGHMVQLLVVRHDYDDGQASDEESNRARLITSDKHIRYLHKKGNKRMILKHKHQHQSCPSLMPPPTSITSSINQSNGCRQEPSDERGVLKSVWRRKMFAHDLKDLPSWEATRQVEKERWDPKPFRLPTLDTLRTTLPRELSSTNQGYPNSILGYYKSVKKAGDDLVEAAARNPDILRAVRTVDESVASLQQLLRMETAPGLPQAPDRALTRGLPMTLQTYIDTRMT
ncbi:hypothetical protein FOL47_007390 [Perkinsus chesapeaki]|uniref:Cilia- and flagella-associated protein 36 n=1 Tax=Perkinsus chesapeaki TaxID=330153 RepID=A0A7J6LKT3_PERCH|nr:hypothetical protein FOL47_007390 [Perkinsus chesapeaki]